MDSSQSESARKAGGPETFYYYVLYLVFMAVAVVLIYAERWRRRVNQ